jgi:1-deoxy-D-xylulose-5-phosphate reductoisomerase
MRRVAVLGATGSIGSQALEVIDRHPGLELVAASSGSQSIDGLAPLTQVGGDPTELLERAEADVVLNAVVGFAGVTATLWALEHGADLALANKESLVAAGELALAARERGGGRLLPVDSEHSAVFQCLESRDPGTIHSVVLTASGGPFRGRNRSELVDVTPEDALAHPTWSMGPKITVDSSTLMNKGLEVIEAHWLFGTPSAAIDVVVHPQSVVHSLVELTDGSIIAQLGVTDMRLPIQYAFSWPERWDGALPTLNLLDCRRLEFEAPAHDRFPCLRLAYQALDAGDAYPVVLNAANEVAVASFLEGAVPFPEIAASIDAFLEAAARQGVQPPATLAAIRELDAWARTYTWTRLRTVSAS